MPGTGYDSHIGGSSQLPVSLDGVKSGLSVYDEV